MLSAAALDPSFSPLILSLLSFRFLESLLRLSPPLSTPPPAAAPAAPAAAIGMVDTPVEAAVVVAAATFIPHGESERHLPLISFRADDALLPLQAAGGLLLLHMVVEVVVAAAEAKPLAGAGITGVAVETDVVINVVVVVVVSVVVMGAVVIQSCAHSRATL